MISRNVAEYVANVRYKTDLKSLKRAKKFITSLESGFTKTINRSVNNGLMIDRKAFSSKINRVLATQPINIKIGAKNISVDKFAVRRTINDAVSSSVLDNRAIMIKNFRVDQVALNKAINDAINAKTSYKVGIKPVLNSRGQTQQGVSSSRNRINDTPYWQRQLTQRTPNTSLLMTGTVLTGGFGLNELNKQVQDWTMLETKMTAVIGDVEKAQEKIEHLKRLGQNIGSNPLDLANSYVQMLASSQGKPFEKHLDAGFGTFTRYGKVMGLDEEAMKGSMRAVNQMLSKQQIMAEELRGQLAERLPAAVRLMADAVADGDTAKLNKMMERGELDPNVVLPKFFAQMQKAVDKGLSSYLQTSRYHQGKAQAATGMLTDTFARNGGESGLVRIWRNLQEALNASLPAAKLLGEKFYDLSKYTDQLSNIVKLTNEAIEKNGHLLSDNFWSIIKAAGILYTRFGKIVYAATWLTDIIEDLTSWAKGGESVFKNMFEAIKNLDFKEFMTNFKAVFSDSAVEMLKFIGAIWAASKAFSFLMTGIKHLVKFIFTKTPKSITNPVVIGSEKNPPIKTPHPKTVPKTPLVPLAGLAATGIGAAAVGMGAMVYTNPDEMKVAYDADPWANSFFQEKERQRKKSELNARLYQEMMTLNPDFVDLMNGFAYSKGNSESGFMDMFNRIKTGSSQGEKPSIENVTIHVDGLGKSGSEIGKEIANAMSMQWSMTQQFMPVGG